ncbi:MAG TPA: NUDIX domain-containing protein [Croceibacterium sp.]|jgi:predicted NUDIX family NTP pyrophosphohydrolase
MKHSAGVLIYRRSPALEVLLVHPGGPYWTRRDRGAWQIPKGGIEPGEDPATAARREAMEELGVTLDGRLAPLGDIRQAGGKRVTAFAVEHDLDPALIQSNSFEMEWPPKSGKIASFPEIGKGRWMGPEEARDMILPSQLPLLDRLSELLSAG